MTKIIPQIIVLFMVLVTLLPGSAIGLEALEPGETLLELPMDAGQAEADWKDAEYWEAIQNEELGRLVMHPTRNSVLTSRRVLEPPYEVTLHVRWINREPPTYGASLYVGATTMDLRSETPAYRIMLRPYSRGTTRRMQVTLSRGNSIINTFVDKRPRRYDDYRMYFTRRFTTISPVWEPDFRAEIEAAMAPVDDPDVGWARIRVVVGSQEVKVFWNGICVGNYRHPETVLGRVALEARDPHMHVATLQVRRPAMPASRFETVDLEACINATALGASGNAGLAPDALPAEDSTIEIDGIPFRLPHREKGDHVDIGTSLFHYRNNDQRVNMRNLWLPTSQRDANRLILGVPKRPYRRLWLLAASDEEPNSVPLLTVRFYRQAAGFPIDSEVEVPAFSATVAKDVKPIAVAGHDGGTKRLWLVPVELDSNRIASQFRDQETLAIELTKQVYPYTPYPDPMYFSSFQGGPPSAVRVFAATLEEAPVMLTTRGTRPGSVFLKPEHPVWQATLHNMRNTEIRGRLTVAVTGPYRKALEEKTLSVQLLPLEEREVSIPFHPDVLGLHSVQTEFAIEDGLPESQRVTVTTEGRFVQLPADNRRTTEKNSRWGLWCWQGGHLTNPDPDENGYLIRAAGARGMGQRDYADRHRWKLFARPVGISYRAPRWAFDDPDNLEAREAHARDMVEKAKKHVESAPDAGYLAYFVEDVADLALMFGEYPKHLGREGMDWTEEQRKAYEARFLAAKVALEAIRKEVPKAKISLGWTHPQFQVPLLRMGFPAELFDAIGIDFPTFMRMPEMPLRDISPNRMWVFKTEMDRLGYGKKPIVHHETYFPSSQPLALGEKVASDYTVRFGVLSLALGSDRLMNCFSLHDCADYWGNQHYGASGLVGRFPEFVPKPAFPAYAVMTRLLDVIMPDGYIPTGSMSTYCVSFVNRNSMVPYTHVYALWTLRGKRDLRLDFEDDGAVTRVDAQGNTQTLNVQDGSLTVTLSPTPLWITSGAAITGASVADKAVYEAKPGGPTRALGSLGSGWESSGGPYPRLEENNPILAPFAFAPMVTEVVLDPEGGPALQLALETVPEERPTVDWYTVLEPEEPVAIPGRAKALGVWVNGRSSWGRVIFEVEDADGERFLSTGNKDNWNADDSRQAAYFNFDGWRYLEFPLPSHEPYDNYRGFSTTWWGWDREGVVDLPLKLVKVIVTHRSHHVYVNELIPVPDRRVDLGRLVAVYADEDSQADNVLDVYSGPTFAAPETDLSQLPNLHTELAAKSELPAPTIKRFFKPEKWYDGTQIMVELDPVENVRQYYVYVSAYKDGTGAMQMGTSTEPTILVRRLRPEFPLYFFATYHDQRRRESAPSAIKRVLLKDDFPNK